MSGQLIEANAPPKRRLPSFLWLMIALFVSLPALILLYGNPPKLRASDSVRLRLMPYYQALQQREADARANHPQNLGASAPNAYFAIAHLSDGLPRHAPQGDKQAVDAVLSYDAWVEALESDHSPTKRAQLDQSDLKREDVMHRRLTSDIDTRFSPRPAYAPPQSFYDYPVLLIIPALLFVSIFVVAFAPSVRDGLQRRALQRNGIPMTGTILSAQSTGVTINRVPQLLIRVQLETGETAEYRMLSLYGMGIAPGTPVQLLVDPGDHRKVTYA